MGPPPRRLANDRRLVSVGNVIVDILARVPALPEPGGDVMATASGMAAGGSFNVLVAASRQGLPAAYAGGHGTGPLGDLVRSALAEANVDILQPPISEVDTGYDIALLDSSGERTFVTAFGAEARLETIPVLPGPDDLVHVSGYGLLAETNGAVIVDWLGRIPAETLVLLDPGPLVGDIPAAWWQAALARADWISCNEREAALITGWDDPRTAALRLEDMTGPDRSGHALVRIGPDGCLHASGGFVEWIPGFAATAVDTNGAGDAHVGAFLAALAEGVTSFEAARRANACAALAVTREGPATAPTRDEVLALLG